MATDGDLYQKRMQCGFGKAYRIACADGPAADEAVVVVRGFENLLRQIPMPALGPLLSSVSAGLAEHGSELYAADLAAGMQCVKERVARIASLHASAQTTAELAAVVSEVAFERLEDGVPFSADGFQNECRERVLQRMLRRYHFGPSEANVMGKLGIDRLTRQERENAVRALVQPQAFAALRAVEASPAGVLRKPQPPQSSDVNTKDGLEQEPLF